MNRTDFETLRDLPGKRIEGDIRFAKGKSTSPLLVADRIVVDNAAGREVRMNLSFNPETGAKTINVSVQGLGPICRLDVDGPAHRPAGRSHKHSLRSVRCPDRNLRDGVDDRPDLSGNGMRELFDKFCTMANIVHQGNFHAPDEGST